MAATIVSRRSRHRLGCRYKKRGLDANGNVANGVETEQILACNDHVLAFVQYRGSIPVFWTQEPQNKEYRPAVNLHKTPAETQTAFLRHMEQLVSHFGPHQFWVNLINRQGREAVVGEAFKKVFAAAAPSHITYHPFDFHHHCKRSTMHKVWEIVDAAQVSLDNMGFTNFVVNGDVWHPVTQQTGVVRTNCMDCLDRTNVTQSVFARDTAARQLLAAGILKGKEGFPPALLSLLQRLWAANGNQISRQYAGTDAMKSEATKAGRNKLLGALNDGRKSLTRYYLNTFKDAYRQQVIDLCQLSRSTSAVFNESLALERMQHVVLQDTTTNFVNRVLRKVCLAFVRARARIVVVAETIVIVTSEHLYVAYVSFADETLHALGTHNLHLLHRGESGPLAPGEIKALSLHTNSIAEDASKSRSKIRFPVVRLAFRALGEIEDRLEAGLVALWLSELRQANPYLVGDAMPDEETEELEAEALARFADTRPAASSIITRAAAWTTQALNGHQDELASASVLLGESATPAPNCGSSRADSPRTDRSRVASSSDGPSTRSAGQGTDDGEEDNVDEDSEMVSSVLAGLILDSHLEASPANPDKDRRLRSRTLPASVAHETLAEYEARALGVGSTGDLHDMSSVFGDEPSADETGDQKPGSTEKEDPAQNDVYEGQERTREEGINGNGSEADGDEDDEDDEDIDVEDVPERSFSEEAQQPAGVVSRTKLSGSSAVDVEANMVMAPTIDLSAGLGRLPDPVLESLRVCRLLLPRLRRLVCWLLTVFFFFGMGHLRVVLGAGRRQHPRCRWDA
ncbi:uncharacterized protein MONBRDRAFT_12950 [Monosiga brevicollis MX1]|uniref:SAC domain-containing protein n=1 Tax=Monosiga brevicollis TaxID=81824 RepID=A9VDU3_MONBE|nr:uncharacterized protein MONBRDRAFT_12950 [Monosiga brevicollis MX1]EDQ84307.1 predicted protein [Monosiga brevicollis MX1]|eukprot:XP_001750877.1 hypothetical protein [Monosiga brevicollis MX1]